MGFPDVDKYCLGCLASKLFGSTRLAGKTRAGYVRTQDGFVTSVSQPVESFGDAAGTDALLAVPFVNPGSNRGQRSFLRVTNHGTQTTNVTVLLWDDDGSGP